MLHKIINLTATKLSKINTMQGLHVEVNVDLDNVIFGSKFPRYSLHILARFITEFFKLRVKGE
jgi:hypothetical protein